MNPNDIYFYQPSKATVDTSQIFEVTYEGDTLRVKNENVNCLFSNLTIDAFQIIYNDFIQHLNLNFLPIIIDKNLYELTTDEQKYLVQTIITSWIYYYTINDMRIKVKRSDFAHPYMVNYLLRVLDKKFGIDTNVSLTIGASILRQDFKKYCKTVEGRRWYYNR
ncbi:hypothetical protein [Hymenobacter amundsenii]|uniref:hypothetical protein n=1 Tax=Hymenobacter amundsenii TaxID=2006685 RepID=UPI001A8DA3A8|nr:hypothetical protein [Hymenobacter amundsenii]